jgi:large subunit ribosomal protein L18
MFKKDYKRRIKKKFRVRKKISGTAQKPRISVFRSANQIYAQVIDDTTGKTLVSASTKSSEILSEISDTKGKIEKSKIVGKLLGKKAVESGITEAVFDKSGYDYHGRIKALAEGARESGVKF